MSHHLRFNDESSVSAEWSEPSADQGIATADGESPTLRKSPGGRGVYDFMLGSTVSGVYMLVAGAAMLSAGVFLIVQIKSAPLMVIETGVFGGFGVIAGVVTIAVGIRCLATQLRVDDAGIDLQPGPGSFRIPWTGLAG